MPGTGASKAERQQKEYDLVAAPAQNVIFRVAVSAFEDLGKASVAISDFQRSDGDPGVLGTGCTIRTSACAESMSWKRD